MDNYGLVMFGSLVIEKVQVLPDWGISDTGRILYDLTTNNYWLGGHSITVGTDGWIPLGITSTAIHSYNIDWDTNMTGAFGKVNASYMPCRFGDTTSTQVQAVLDNIYTTLTSVQAGDKINANSIRDYHLDITGTHRVTADSIPVLNDDGYFSGTNPTIEDALSQLTTRNASGVPLDTDSGHFGADLTPFSTAVNVQGALETIEDYLAAFNASKVPVYYSGCGCDTNVQFAIEALYALHDAMSIVDLADVPAYDVNHRFLKSNGVNACEWVTLEASDITALYPGNQETNVQGAIYAMGTTISNMQTQINNLVFSAEDIVYQNNAYPQLGNIDDAIDLIYSTFYNPGNPQKAVDVACNAIGPGNVTVQAALTFLKSQVDAINSMLPCQVGAEDVACTTSAGATNVQDALTYIMGFIYHAIDAHGITYGYFTPST